uniref:Uncharacterized protein n=1 Tax=Cyanoderma ruficeps TaxID=181631 RepID=A0A8C3QJ31_9PASS
MAEDHDLTDGEAAIEVAEVLPDVAQGELLLTQLDHDGVGDDPLRKGPHGFLVGKAGNQDSSSQQSSPVDADALTGEALRVDHDVGLVQHEQGDLRQVQDVLLEAPVQCGAWCPDDDLLLQSFMAGNSWQSWFCTQRGDWEYLTTRNQQCLQLLLKT